MHVKEEQRHASLDYADIDLRSQRKTSFATEMEYTYYLIMI